MGGAEGAGILRCAQDDSKTKARSSNGKGRIRSPSGMTTKKRNGKNNEQERTMVPTALAWHLPHWLKQYF
jgi:hypothetical protein